MQRAEAAQAKRHPREDTHTTKPANEADKSPVGRVDGIVPSPPAPPATGDASAAGQAPPTTEEAPVEPATAKKAGRKRAGGVGRPKVTRLHPPEPRQEAPSHELLVAESEPEVVTQAEEARVGTASPAVPTPDAADPPAATKPKQQQQKAPGKRKAADQMPAGQPKKPRRGFGRGAESSLPAPAPGAEGRVHDIAAVANVLNICEQLNNSPSASVDTRRQTRASAQTQLSNLGPGPAHGEVESPPDGRQQEAGALASGEEERPPPGDRGFPGTAGTPARFRAASPGEAESRGVRSGRSECCSAGGKEARGCSEGQEEGRSRG